jgi:hypothetical protein
MFSWVKAICREWLPATYFGFSFVSSAATFSHPCVSGRVKGILILNSAVGFILAAIRVDRKRVRKTKDKSIPIRLPDVEHRGLRLGAI